ncbi:lactose transport system permease protein LacF [Clostridium tepidiprofundi DSM 19306]|uniref:Lactose transport system permease protein LacF n=1 Tax=Clostridium tepidiprofundi DSM 19306 TaxID=1121338 RepID=A0A151B3D6_9CLOT|nr:sugar ABC transporter permease [Clostridium tepidiprofundi]KYH34421.1 lactose transport system permease protein LacF [Clostridium tepidiprofundi DSM 19306]
MKKFRVLIFDKLKYISKKLAPYGYLLPLGILLTSFYVIPIIMSFIFSFTKYNIMTPAKYIGLKNYYSIFKDKIFVEALKNTLYFTAIVVPVQTILSLIIAVWLTSREKSKLAEFVKGVMFIPVISSMILISIVWRILLNGDSSPLNIVFTIFGLNTPNWLGNSKLALPTMMAISIWKNIGYFMIIYIAGIMDIPQSYYEAAEVDGASRWNVFKNITVPLLKPTTIMVVFIGCIWSLQTFDIVYTLTGGGPGLASITIVLHIYNLAFKQFNAGYAMAVANILFLIIAIISITQKKFIKRDKSTY